MAKAGLGSVNPILPLDELIPDVEARVFKNSQGEERVYLYGSHDVFGSETWCSYQYRIYSSPIDDLCQWTDHGVSFASRQGEGYFWNGEDTDGLSWSNGRLYAPDVNKIGELYYLVVCNEECFCLGMALSKNPEGPFSPAQKILYDDGSETSSIDPTLYVENDGETQKVYLFWGQRPQFGARGLLGAELIQDEDGIYRIVKKSTERVIFTGEQDEFGFYEGASIRKIHGRYYILYPSDHGKGIHMMSYAVSDAPLGPYRFGGDILDNDGCDLEPGNNHGSFCEINGQWYLFYHRGFGNSNMQRRVCVEKIYFDEKGCIGGLHGDMVSMTNHGFGEALSPYQKIEASYATHVRVEGFKSNCYLTEIDKNTHPLIHVQNNNCVEYRDFDFGQEETEVVFLADAAVKNQGAIHIIFDNPHYAAAATIHICEDCIQKNIQLRSTTFRIKGIHTLYLVFSGPDDKEICDLYSFAFSKIN